MECNCDCCKRKINTNKDNYVITVFNTGRKKEAEKSTICYKCAVLFFSADVISFYKRKITASYIRRKQLTKERASIGALSTATGNLFTDD